MKIRREVLLRHCEKNRSRQQLRPFCHSQAPLCPQNFISQNVGQPCWSVARCRMHIQNRTQKSDSGSCMKECCSPRSAPIAMKALVPVFTCAPEAAWGCSSIARSRSIKNVRQEGLAESSLIMRLLIEMFRWRRPALCNDSCPSTQPSSAGSKADRELAL